MQRVVGLAVARVQRPVAATVGIAALRARLGALEVGQHVAIVPLRGALGCPALEIEWVTAHVHHAVYRRRATENFAARGMQLAAVEMDLWLGEVTPVIFRTVHRNRQRARHLDENRSIRTAVLQQQHFRGPVLGQTIGKHAPSRTGADDDVVKNFISHERGPRCGTPVSAAAGRTRIGCGPENRAFDRHGPGIVPICGRGCPAGLKPADRTAVPMRLQTVPSAGLGCRAGPALAVLTSGPALRQGGIGPETRPHRVGQTAPLLRPSPTQVGSIGVNLLLSISYRASPRLTARSR